MRERIKRLQDMLTPTVDSSPIKGWIATSERVRVIWKLPKHVVTYERRADDAPMGPFGGGWKWNLGVQRGKKTWYFALIRFSIKVDQR